MKIKLTTPEYCFYCLLLIITLIIPRELNSKNLDVLLSNPFLLEINNSTNTPSLTMIPVAFHIIKKSNGTGEVTDEQIHAQVDVLNYAFGSISNTNFRFILYAIDRETNDFWATAQFNSSAEQNMKENLAIYPSHVLNIYTCVLDYAGGYSRWPWDYPENNYMHGCVIDYTTIVDGGDQYQDLGYVCVHEVGHYMGLLHTFENCVTTAGDSVSDTPPQANATGAGEPCGTFIAYCEGYSGENEVAKNIMDYLSDICREEFTPDQITRMNQKMAQLKPSMNGWYITLEQRKESNELMSGTSVGIWEPEISAFENVNIPSTPIKTSVGNNKILRGNQSLFSSEKFNRWTIGGLIGGSFTEEADVTNHHIFTIGDDQATYISQFKHSFSGTTIKNSLEGADATGGSIYFKDPWYIDQVDPAYGNNLKNRGLNPFPRQRSSDPFYPDYNTVFQNGSDPSQSYKGVFLDQNPTFDPNVPNYLVQVDQEQTIPINGVNHKFFFQNWSGTNAQFQYPNALETGVVFTDGNAVVTANLKGQLLSNQSNGFSNNGQRKIVRDNSGYYHSVYVSSGLGWKSKSITTDFLGSWTKDETIFYDVPVVNPSIDLSPSGTNEVIVAEVDDSNSGQYRIYLLESDLNGSNSTFIADIDAGYVGQSFPVVAYCEDEIFIVYKTSASSKLKYARKYFNGSVWELDTNIDIPNSTSNSKYPSVVASKSGSEIYITWQEGSSQIKFIDSHTQGFNRNFFNYTTVSSGSGYSSNTNPSISLSSDGPFVSWTGSRKENSPNKILSKEDIIFVYRALMRAKATSWGDFYVMGENVNYTNNNSTPSVNNETVIAYSRDNGQLTPWAKRVGGYYTGFGSLSHTGIQVNLSNGTSLSNLKALVFNNSTPPYPINRSTTDFTNSIPKETAGEEITYGRTGVVSKSDVEFVFTVEDIMLDNTGIEFTARIDTLPVHTLEELNQAARSRDFNLEANSSFYFSLYYLVINPEIASTIMSDSDYVRFKLQLVKTVGDEVVGTFDDITFTKDNAFDHENIDYKVDCTNIESGNYYLRLLADDNCHTGLSIANIRNDAGNLPKKNYVDVNFKGETSPITYELSQNYPNPFNPSTTIKYQIPNAGNVSLKIYDILGREVTTLVDEFKNEGRYEVIFNASKLASGVYIYTIKSNDFTASKKLMLLK